MLRACGPAASRRGLQGQRIGEIGPQVEAGLVTLLAAAHSCQRNLDLNCWRSAPLSPGSGALAPSTSATAAPPRSEQPRKAHAQARLGRESGGGAATWGLGMRPSGPRPL